MWHMKPPSSMKMVVHSRVMGLTQRMSDYPMSGNTIVLSSVCIAPVFVPKVESGEWANVPKVELGEQRVAPTLFFSSKGLWFVMIRSPIVHATRCIRKGVFCCFKHPLLALFLLSFCFCVCLSVCLFVLLPCWSERSDIYPYPKY